MTSHWFKPSEQIRLSGMSTEAAEPAYRCAHNNGLAKYLDSGRPFHEKPPERASSLIADNYHNCTGKPQIVLEVVQNAAGIAHTGSSKDQARSLFAVERSRLVSGFTGGKCGQVTPQLT